MIYHFMQKKNAPLIFSLIGGLGYFMVVLKFITVYTASSQGWLLGFFFFPAIVCGAALVLLKTLKKCLDEENRRKINFLVVMHIILFLIGFIFVIEMLF